MENNSNLARISRYMCIQDLNKLTINDFKNLEITIKDLRKITDKKHISMMLFDGFENNYVVSLEVYKINNKINIKYIKTNWESAENFIINRKIPTLYNGKIQSEEIFALIKMLKSNFGDKFIDLVCSKLDEFAKEIDFKENLLEQQIKREFPQVLSKKNN